MSMRDVTFIHCDELPVISNHSSNALLYFFPFSQKQKNRKRNVTYSPNTTMRMMMPTMIPNCFSKEVLSPILSSNMPRQMSSASADPVEEKEVR
jgi:hypothetical protein